MNEYKERVELRAATIMSINESLVTECSLIKQAHEFGMPAIAITDWENTVAFPEAYYCAKDAAENEIKVIYGMRAELVLATFAEFDDAPDKTVFDTFPVTLLVKNKKGMQNLYRLLEKIDFCRYYMIATDHTNAPALLLSELNNNREGLLVGLQSEYLGVNDIERFKDLCSRIHFDYIEVIPPSEIYFFPGVNNVMEAKEYIKKTLVIAEEISVPVVAVGNVRYLNSEDRNIWACNIVNDEQGLSDEHGINEYHLRSTPEMLEEFTFLGRDKAKEIVIVNTNKIADMVDWVNPLPEKKYVPVYPNGDDKLRELCYVGLKDKYGDNPDKKIIEKLEWELESAISNKYAVIFLYEWELVNRNALKPWQRTFRSMAPSSLILYLLGVTQWNPFDEELPLYSELYLGPNGDRKPDLEITVPGNIQEATQISIQDFPGTEALYPTTVPELSKIENKKRVLSLYNKHPSVGLICPSHIDLCEIVPLCRTAAGNTIQVSYSPYPLYGTFIFADVAADPELDIMTRLVELTGYYPTGKDVTGNGIMRMATGSNTTYEYGINKIDWYGQEVKEGTRGISFFDRARKLGIFENGLEIDSFSDLVKVHGYIHGTHVWEHNQKALLMERELSVSEFYSNREDVYERLLNVGIEKKEAFYITDRVRKGKSLTCETEELLLEHGMPEQEIEILRKIKYLWSRAGAVESVLNALRMLYYKIYYPMAFYKAYFEFHGDQKLKDIVAINDIDGAMAAIVGYKVALMFYEENATLKQMDECIVAEEYILRRNVMEKNNYSWRYGE